ncbi:target of Sbf [Madurella fahalii]|uniref:glucan endo-1,3-beta-D-glucosidase n=1 Tax=Madurella fahalii TaxID=1157608 RepID=A0ABQ0FZF2_9PEZI
MASATMKPNFLAALLAAGGIANGAVTMIRAALESEQFCNGTVVSEKGNLYCGLVSQIVYKNVGLEGQYNEVVSMNQQTGECQFSPRKFSGPLAPFNEPLSLHIRGPINLKQVAVYMLSTTASESQKRVEGAVGGNSLELGSDKRHGYQHRKNPGKGGMKVPKEEDKRGHPTIWLTTTINGKAESRTNNYGGEGAAVTSLGTPAPSVPTSDCQASGTLNKARVTSTQAADPTNTPSMQSVPDQETVTKTVTVTAFPATTAVPAYISYPKHLNSSVATHTPSFSTVSVTASTINRVMATPSLSSSTRSNSASYSSSSPGSGDDLTTGFIRIAYYNAEQQKAKGLMFLGNYGGQGSGKWTPTFGNTLSYLNANGTGGASSPTILHDTTLLSGHEAVILTNQPCDSSCGYVQPGAVAYKGFPTPSKMILLLDFSMPHDTNTATATATTPSPPYDMPAIWLLNAGIPYTAQYHKCNCWASGCGELDVFEVLTPGEERATSAVHIGGRKVTGEKCFKRPVGGRVRVAVVFDEEKRSVEVRVLDGGMTGFGDAAGRWGFPGVLAAGEVKRLREGSGEEVRGLLGVGGSGG